MANADSRWRLIYLIQLHESLCENFKIFSIVTETKS